MTPTPTEDNIKKRLNAVNTTQESVQTCSKWILHHRDSVDKVANCWMELYKAANDKIRTALIYVLNDVVQRAASKRDVNVTLTFHPHLINATTISSLNVKKAISRCILVFEQRNIYPPHIIEEMKSALVSKIATEKDETQMSSVEIELPNLIRGIDNFYKNELLTEKAREILSRSSFNFKESVQARVKDRSEGVKALTDMDASRQKLVSFLESVENHRKKTAKLMEMMRQAQIAFNLQLRDVTVVNDAYKNFAEGIRETKQQLDQMESSGVLLGESPPRDAPSPTAGDDPFLHGVDGEELNGGGDDMEMDDEDKPGPSSCFLKKEYIASIPMPESDPRLQRMGASFGQPHHFMAPTNGPMSGTRTVGATAPIVMDPRQARFFPPPQPVVQQQMHNMAAVMQPVAPGCSPPPSSTGEDDARVMGKMQIDTSQPPPNAFFNFAPPSIANGNNSGGAGQGVEMTSPMLFNPNNPPPSFSQMSAPPPSLMSQQLSPPPNFSIPPPSLVHPPPLFAQQSAPHPQFGSSPQKRRNSSESNFNSSKRGRNGSGNWQNPHHSQQPGGWRRNGGEAGRYNRH